MIPRLARCARSAIQHYNAGLRHIHEACAIQQIRYARELSGLVELAKNTGAIDDPLIRDWVDRCKARPASTSVRAEDERRARKH